MQNNLIYVLIAIAVFVACCVACSLLVLCKQKRKQHLHREFVHDDEDEDAIEMDVLHERQQVQQQHNPLSCVSLVSSQSASPIYFGRGHRGDAAAAHDYPGNAMSSMSPEDAVLMEDVAAQVVAGSTTCTPMGEVISSRDRGRRKSAKELDFQLAIRSFSGTSNMLMADVVDDMMNASHVTPMGDDDEKENSNENLFEFPAASASASASVAQKKSKAHLRAVLEPLTSVSLTAGLYGPNGDDDDLAVVSASQSDDADGGELELTIQNIDADEFIVQNGDDDDDDDEDGTDGDDNTDGDDYYGNDDLDLETAGSPAVRHQSGNGSAKQQHKQGLLHGHTPFDSQAINLAIQYVEANDDDYDDGDDSDTDDIKYDSDIDDIVTANATKQEAKTGGDADDGEDNEEIQGEAHRESGVIKEAVVFAAKNVAATMKLGIAADEFVVQEEEDEQDGTDEDSMCLVTSPTSKHAEQFLND